MLYTSNCIAFYALDIACGFVGMQWADQDVIIYFSLLENVLLVWRGKHFSCRICRVRAGTDWLTQLYMKWGSDDIMHTAKHVDSYDALNASHTLLFIFISFRFKRTEELWS